MFGSIGVPELIIILVVSGVWLIPVGVAIWVVLTLNRVRTDQQVIRAKLEALERDRHPSQSGTNG
jgi:hypothetical protein